jgi:vitamin B12 transporter
MLLALFLLLHGASASGQDPIAADAGTSDDGLAPVDAAVSEAQPESADAAAADASVAPALVPTPAPPPSAEVVVPLDAASATAPSAPPTVEAAPSPITVTARGDSRAARRRQSAEAVSVVELEEARRESADLGEVLARTEGVGIRRSGGLGSDAKFSLNGLTDDQIRFFLDGIPLDFAGYPLGIANVPVNLIERVEIYSGVVPVRYGADALGGAVDLRTPSDVRGTHAAASYEVGSFGTHRATVAARHLHKPSGFFANVDAFVDSARNDYYVDAKVADRSGGERPVRVRRFHDHYKAAGAHAEVGLVDRPWARRLLLRGFFTGFDKEIQNNPSMSIAYGGLRYGERTGGTSLRYEHRFAHAITVNAVAGYTHQLGHYVDKSDCVWNWLGECTQKRMFPGEIDAKRHDQVNYDHTAYGRFELGTRPAEAQALRFSLAPTFFKRTGDERIDDPSKKIDELHSRRIAFSLVGGVEYEVDLFDDRLENIVFGKFYMQQIDAEEVRPGGLVSRDRNTYRGGAGDALRLRVTEWLMAKASYEYATRLPPPEEIFGDNVFIRQNLLLKPESSHNGNLGLMIDAKGTSGGDFRGSINGFLRLVDDFIIRFGNERNMAFLNVYDARITGVETSAGWTSKREYVALDGNFTYQDLRNVSTTGTFGDYAGDRIPNRPYMFANATARFQLRDLLAQGDILSLTSYTRYVHEFWLGWESVGSASSRSTVPRQVVETLVLTYLRKFSEATASAALEAQNIGDAKVFDYYGVQRPGRAYYLKLTVEH